MILKNIFIRVLTYFGTQWAAVTTNRSLITMLEHPPPLIFSESSFFRSFPSKPVSSLYFPHAVLRLHIVFQSIYIKLIYSEKATKFCEISTLVLSYVVPIKSKVEISQNFVTFSEYINFTNGSKTFEGGRVQNILKNWWRHLWTDLEAASTQWRLNSSRRKRWAHSQW